MVAKLVMIKIIVLIIFSPPTQDNTGATLQFSNHTRKTISPLGQSGAITVLLAHTYNLSASNNAISPAASNTSLLVQLGVSQNFVDCSKLPSP